MYKIFIFLLPSCLNFVVKLKFETENWINMDVNLCLKGMTRFVEGSVILEETGNIL